MELCAVMTAADAQAAARALGPADGLTVVAQGALGAVFAPAAAGLGVRALLSVRGRRREAGRALVARAALLERLMGCGDLLPAAPGGSLRVADAATALAANAGLLAAALARCAGRVQHQVTVAWDPARALARYADAPELAAARAACADRVALGEALRDGAEALRARVGADYAARIAAATDDVASLPTEPPAGLANLVCLTGRDGVAKLEQALEAVDADWPDGLSIKLIGPSPVVSFAALTFETPARSRLAAAVQTLGLDASSLSAETVTAAFRARARALHPDAGGEADGGVALGAAREAATLLTRVVLARRALAEAGLPAVETPPLAALLREGGPAVVAEAAA
jgi:hypothetical protein